MARKIRWTIGIPTVPARREQRKNILAQLEPQLYGYDDIELIVLEDNRAREYGPKLQAIIDIAQGDYVCFIDDDDRISNDYVARLRSLMDDNKDCIGMVGQVHIQGRPPKLVRYSINYPQWKDLDDVYLRNPQHLTPIKTKLVKRVPWVGHLGADRDWSHKMASKGLLKTENFCEGDPVYFYDVQTDNREGVWH